MWKKNSPFLYDMCLSTALEWPTLTTEWFPDKKDDPDKNYSNHRLLIGTHTAQEAAHNYIQICNVQLPKTHQGAKNPRDYDENSGEFGGHGTMRNEVPIKFTIMQRIEHPGEINRARYMPQNPDIIGTMCVNGDVCIWDRSKHTMVPNGTPNPQIRLRGHEKEGYGIHWNPHKEGHLATGAEDHTVRLW
jgi:histone-binding protein RBBP4